MIEFRNLVKFKGQDYDILKKQQLSRGVKFVDEEFPEKSMHLEGLNTSVHPLQFMRPTQLNNSPCIFNHDLSSGLIRGFVRNLNILLAFTCLRYSPKPWSKVIPDLKYQEWDLEHVDKHSGIFKFCFWQEGMSIEVIVDDLLPCQNNQSIALSSSFPNEFWPPLLEKAYAKLMGGYDKLAHIRLEEIIMDLSGGATEPMPLQCLNDVCPMKQVEFYEKIQEAFTEGTIIMFCTKKRETDEKTNAKIGWKLCPEQFDTTTTATTTNNNNNDDEDNFNSPNLDETIFDSETGLCFNYGYLMTKFCTVPKDVSLFGSLKDAFRKASNCPIQARLLRLRCPLALAKGGSGLGEWKGSFSNNSTEWEAIDLGAKQRLNLTFDSESDFWIPLEHVLKHMSGVILCHMPDTNLISIGKRSWNLNEHHGAWHGHQAGGGIQFRNSFLQNPQYYFDVLEQNSEVLLSLVRKYDRDPVTMAIETESYPVPIGMGLFKVEMNRTVRIHKLGFCRTISVQPARPYRVCFFHAMLTLGRYVIIPFLEQPGTTSSYLLRIFFSKRFESKELVLDIPPDPFMSLFYSPVNQAVRMHIYSALCLLWPDSKNPPSPYCIIKNEGDTLRTAVVRGNSNPVWDECFILYRRKPQRVPIVIEIYNKKTFGFDTFLGRHCFKYNELNTQTQQEVSLFGRDTKEERFMLMKGSLFVEFYSVGEREIMNI